MRTKVLISTFFIGIALIPFDFVFNIGIIRLTLAEIVLSLALLLWSVSVVLKRSILNIGPLIFPFLFFLVVSLMSLLNAHDKMVTLREFVQFVWLFCLFYLVSHVCKEYDCNLKIMRILLFVAIVVSIVGIYQYFFITKPIDLRIAKTRLRSHGLYDQPNAFGSFLIGIIPLIFGVYLTAVHRSENMLRTTQLDKSFLLNKKILIVFLFIISVGLMTTFSRGSWFGLIFSLIFFSYLIKRKKIWKHFALLISVIVIAVVLVVSDITMQPQVVKRDFSNRQRTLLIQTAFSMIKDYPINGLGLGNFHTRLKDYASPELYELMHQDYNETTETWFVNPNKIAEIELVHNMFLQVMVEVGILGLIGFIWILIVFYREALRRFRESVSEEESYIRAAVITSVTAILAGGFWGWPFSHGVQELLIINLSLSINRT